MEWNDSQILAEHEALSSPLCHVEYPHWESAVESAIESQHLQRLLSSVCNKEIIAGKGLSSQPQKTDAVMNSTALASRMLRS